MDEIINELRKLGWSVDGRTSSKTVRIPTQKVPLLGKSGGELATFGGRVRLRRKDLFVTIGKRTTFFYARSDTGVVSKARVKTSLQDVLAAEHRVQADEATGCAHRAPRVVGVDLFVCDDCGKTLRR